MGHLKKKIVTIAFDDGIHRENQIAKYHDQQSDTNFQYVPLIGAICRGHQLLHVSQSEIQVDGLDSTDKIIEIIEENPFKQEIRLIFIDSPTLGGFNIVNAQGIYLKTNIPVVLLPDETPKQNLAHTYQKIFPHRIPQLDFLRNLPNLNQLNVRINQNPSISRDIFFHSVGIEHNDLIELLNYLSEYSAIPEPLRLAHIIASYKIINRNI